MSEKPERHMIGWWERVDLPDWHVRGLKAKVDTGARTSALHVEDLKLSDDGMAHFTVVLSLEDKEKRVRVHAPVLKVAKVKSSTGEFTMRPFVKTRMRLGVVEKDIEITLVSRSEMTFRMLLGRQALEREFQVDVSHADLMRSHRKPRPARRPGRQSRGEQKRPMPPPSLFPFMWDD